MEPIIQLKNVSKEFKVLNRHEGLSGAFKDLFSKDYKIINAVNDVTMDIYDGEIVGYLGPNGAGKSTTIKMMTGVLKSSSGEIIVNGVNPYLNRVKACEEMGVVFGQRSQLWWALPLIESFKLLKEIYYIDDETYNANLELFDELVNVKELYTKPIRQMSLGQRTLCDILAAFLHDPKVVFLDEPTIGLDVSMKAKIRELIAALNKKKNTTVILTTHDMGDVDALCKRIVIIDKGTCIYDNSIENLRSFFGAYRTLKLCYSTATADNTEEALAAAVEWTMSQLKGEFPNANFTITPEEHWIDVLINEDEVPVMTVLNFIQKKRRIVDVKLEEMSTENVIKKIYEGGDKQ